MTKSQTKLDRLLETALDHARLMRESLEQQRTAFCLSKSPVLPPSQ